MFQGRSDPRPHSPPGREYSAPTFPNTYLSFLDQTHNVYITRPLADFVVSLGTDGRIASQGSHSSALAKDKTLAKEAAAEAEVTNKAEHTVDEAEPAEEAAAPKSDGKLIVAEEIQEGHVGWPARKLSVAVARGR